MSISNNSIQASMLDKGPILDNSCTQTSDIPFHKEEEYSSIKDKFSLYQTMIRDALEIYERAKSLASISDPGVKKTIYRKAEPFQKGHFTMAVIGKMSAGKSTFINAFLHNRNLLPTGHLQTTCALTTIKNAKGNKLCVTYGDDSKKVFKGDFETRLSSLVSIKKEYQNIPINNINSLILDGNSKEKICTKKIVDDLSNVMGFPVDVNLLGQYIDEHPIKDIPIHVDIQCSLPKEYLGWQIVDTPGVDAMGGIEDETIQYLSGSDADGNHNVDAIIFVFSAKSNIQEKSLFQFMASTLDQVTEEARKRCFFIINKGADRDFLNHKEETMRQIDNMFVQTGKIAKDRVIVVDSLCSLLAEDETMDYRHFAKLSSPSPDNWNRDDWGSPKTVLGDIRMELEDDDLLEYNNENVRKLLEKKSNFMALRKRLSEFVSQEKELAFISIIDNIFDEIQRCFEIKQNDILVLTKGLGQSPEQYKDTLQREKGKLDTFKLETNLTIGEISSKYSPENIEKAFSQVLLDLKILEEKVSSNISDSIKKDPTYFASLFPNISTENGSSSQEGFSGLLSLNAMREKADLYRKEVEDIARSIKGDIISKVKDFIDRRQIALSVKLPGIDYDTILYNAREATKTKTEKTKRVSKKKGFWNRIKRGFGRVFDEDWGWNTITVPVPVYHEDKANDVAIYNIIYGLYDGIAQFIENLKKQITKIANDLNINIDRTIRHRQQTIDNYERKEDLVSNIEKLNEECAILELSLESLRIYKKDIV